MSTPPSDESGHPEQAPRLEARVWTLFEAVMEADDEPARRRLLDTSGEAPEVVAEVEALLAAHHSHGGLLDQVVSGGPSTHREDLHAVLAEALRDQYEIEGELGRGGMARVFRARERKHDRRVVLKVLQPGVAALHGPDRFRREIGMVAQLSHPNIVSLIDSGFVDGLAYYVMPFMEGSTLREQLAEVAHQGFPLARTLGILADVAAGLEHAHNLGIVHRDLKPENVLLAGDHAYLLDFGVARALEAGEAQEDDHAGLTRQGDFVGTPRYAAPEQGAYSRLVDHRADLYAWGVLAHEMLTGMLPPPIDDPGVELVGGVTAELRLRRPEAPDWVVELVERCLSPDPRGRPAGMSEVLEVLSPHLAHPVTREGPRRRWPRWAWPAATLAALAATWLVFQWGGEGTEAVPMPVAVAPLQNQTGDPQLEVLGRFAGDWITQGLQELERVSVVPWPASLQAVSGRGELDAVQALARETSAGTVVTGSYYELGGRLQFRAEIVDAASGVVVTAPEPISVHPDSAQAAIRQLGDRINGSLAVATDTRLAGIPGLVLHPPTFEAYQAFDRGVAHYLQQEYDDATADFLEAWQRDTTFATTLLYAATTLLNSGEPTATDSLLDVLESRRDALSSLDDLRWQHLRARLDGDGERELRALREAYSLGPGSRAGYNFAQTAVEMNRPGEALAILEQLDPDRGELRGWAQYWTQLAHARHLLGQFDREAAAAREMRDRYPERRIALVLEVRARAAEGRIDAVQELVSQALTLSPDTYWSAGAAMVVAAEELRAHGHDGWEPWLEGAQRWLSPRIEASPTLTSHRYWMASALYDLRDWSAARAAFMDLSERSPGSNTYRGMAALAAAHLGELSAARAELASPFPFAGGEHAGYLARLAAIESDADGTVSQLSRAFQHRFGGFPWVHASGFDDFRLVAGDPRFVRLLEPAS
jgi:TolB-like protein